MGTKNSYKTKTGRAPALFIQKSDEAKENVLIGKRIFPLWLDVP
uniref:Uncharacterized protein n=1 Tax=Rhizophora mucronata TaxID=61149 RepID=A0A2P2QH28_RHIMU